MRVYTKYRSVKRKKRVKPPRLGYVFAALMLMAGLGWLGWHYRGYFQREKKGNIATRPAAPARPSVPVVPVQPRVQPLLTNRAPEITNTLPPEATNAPPSGQEPLTLLQAQVALVREGISPGTIDGVWGSQTRAAFRAFQKKYHLPATGDLDSATRGQLRLNEPAEVLYQVTAGDVARLRPLGKTWLEKSQQTQLEYETVLELVAEKGQANETLIRALNPGVDWAHLTAGVSLRIPNASLPPIKTKAGFIRISLGEKALEAFDSRTNLLAHFPCSIARRVEKRPVGRLFVETIVFNPNYRFDPAIFPESAEGRKLGRRLIIPAGPNNPVGTAWIGLNLPGYGIHGTPLPEQVGRTESHGCFRLANWCAEYLAKLVQPGTPVYVER